VRGHRRAASEEGRGGERGGVQPTMGMIFSLASTVWGERDLAIRRLVSSCLVRDWDRGWCPWALR